MGQIFLTLPMWVVLQTSFMQLVWGRRSCKIILQCYDAALTITYSNLINSEAQRMSHSWALQTKSCKMKESCPHIKRNLTMQQDALVLLTYDSV